MATEYVETQVEPGDVRNEILETLAEGKPWLFLVADNSPDGGLAMSAEVGGGITGAGMVKKMLELSLKAMP